MDEALKKIVDLINNYVGGLINVAEMPDADKAELKAHLLAAENILLKNGNVKLQQVVSSIAGAVLSRF
jgi:hypothetical protein